MTRGRLWGMLDRVSGRWQAERLTAIEEKVGQFGRSHRDELLAQRQQLVALAKALSTRAATVDLRAIAKQVEDLQGSLLQQDRALSEALERARVFDELANEDRRFARRLDAIAARPRTLIVGPWTGEVGFELLYWIPFVRWVVQTYRLAPERIFVVSRGGVASWYGGLATRYADALSFFSPDEFRQATEELKKQREVGGFDATVVKRVAAAHGLESFDLLHPGMMYRLLMPVWKGLTPVSRVETHAAYAPIAAADAPAPRNLPADYVAARFYFSDCFPDTAANRGFVVSTLEAISRQLPVVLLNTSFAVDDHRDADAGSANVVTLDAEMSPERNLAVQTAAIAGARAFVGTYGGYSYLAPLCGVPSLAFFSARTFRPVHLHVAQRAFERLGGAALVPLDVADLPLVRLALAGTARESVMKTP